MTLDRMPKTDYRVALPSLAKSSSAVAGGAGSGGRQRRSSRAHTVVEQPPVAPMELLMAAPAPAPSQWWRNDPQRVQSVGERLRDAAKREQKTQAAASHAHSKAEANKAWEQHNYAVVVERLNESIAVNSRCDVLRRYRSAAASMAGNRALSVRDAHTAVAINPRGAPNHACAASCLARERRLHEAATHRLEALRLNPGLAGSSSSSCPDLQMRGLLGAVRRERAYPHLARPRHERVLGGGPCRPDVFDSRRQLDMSYHTAGQVMEPDPPLLRVERTTSEALHLSWAPPKDDGGGEIYQYVVELAAFDCAYEPARNGFFEDFREWVVQRGQTGLLGEVIAGHHGLISLHLKAWGCPPHS